MVTHIREEIELHIGECAEFGLTQADMEKYEESTACTAYSRYVLDIGQSEDWFALQISLLPCMLGYGMIAHRLHGLQTTSPPKEPNQYLKWISNYTGHDYNTAMAECRGESIGDKHEACTR